VIPVKGASLGKSRLELPDDLRADLALAFALDTVRAALTAPSVREVVVVAPRDHRGDFSGPGLHAVEDRGEGLLPALGRGAAAVRDGRLGRAFLLGDLPALRGHELEAALRAAARFPRAMVPDAGTGTVLTTARAGIAHRPRFGPGSRRAHRRAGYIELRVPRSWGLANDVDTVEDLGAVRIIGLGPATSAALSAGRVRA
jgi:2-phospho-L-lactate guanylyltransferase